MASAIATLMVNVFTTSHYTKSHSSKNQQIDGDEEKTGEHERHVHIHTHATHGHAQDSVSLVDHSGSFELLRHRVVSQVLELRILVHSVIATELHFLLYIDVGMESTIKVTVASQYCR
ncbi:Uncharacterized protein TCM_002133 [Theobroma cacao]|uniref:Uncharacterized protein n=1 Tax=Theobroma cacao TaxID=3641 RepID=A0A061DKT0_THECC|nr:Uncharacterized protein TCM_002133 [Theobroma cacao]